MKGGGVGGSGWEGVVGKGGRLERHVQHKEAGPASLQMRHLIHRRATATPSRPLLSSWSRHPVTASRARVTWPPCYL